MRKPSASRIGPDLEIKPGDIGEIIATSVIPDDNGGGYTIAVLGGGVLSVRMTAGAQHVLCASLSAQLPDHNREEVLRVLDAWATDAQLRDRAWWAGNYGIDPILINWACNARRDKSGAPMRAEYEAASSRRMHTINAASKKLRARSKK